MKLSALNLQSDVHRRYNPLSGEWVLVSPHRTARPWHGQTETITAATVVSYDPECFLCPGNTRANGVTNPRYESTFVFDNDFAALLPDTAAATISDFTAWCWPRTSLRSGSAASLSSRLACAGSGSASS